MDRLVEGLGFGESFHSFHMLVPSNLDTAGVVEATIRMLCPCVLELFGN